MSKSSKFLKKVPFLKPLEVSEEEVLMVLMRIGGNLEALQGFKNNPEVSVRVNENILKLLQHSGQMLLGLQANLLDLETPEEKEEEISFLKEELKKAHEIISVLTEEKSQLLDKLSELE